MRTDLKVNYADLEILSRQISSYYDALDSIETALENLKKVLEKQKSEAVDELLENISDASYDADDKKNTLSRLKEILDDYLADMRSLLKPIRENEIVRADQYDVWYNITQIEGPIKDIKENAAVECCGNYHTIPAVEDVGEKAKREKEERNYRKLEDFRKSNLVEFANTVNRKLGKIRDIYDKNVKPFEETDDAYRKKLNKLYSECTDTGDKILDSLSFVGSVSFTFLTTLGGILVGAWILAQLPAALAIGLIVAPIVGCIIMAAVPEEYVPDWLKDAKHKDDEIIKTIKEGPFAIVEAIGQGLADTVQTPEGIAAVSATVVGLVLVFKGSKKKKTDLDSETGGVDKVTLGEGGSASIPDLSNKAVKHPMNDHMPTRYAKQLQFMSEEAAEQYLRYKTFFNSNWTDEQVRAALNYGYKEALNNGVTTGKYLFKYLGENVTVYLEDCVFKTGYGDYVYTYDELLKLLGGK